MLDLTALLGTAGHAAGHAAQAAAALSASTLTNRLPCREKAAKEIKTDQKIYIQRYQNAQRATRDPQVSYEKCWNVSYIKRNLEKSHLGKSHPTNPYKPCISHARSMHDPCTSHARLVSHRKCSTSSWNISLSFLKLSWGTECHRIHRQNVKDLAQFVTNYQFI